MSDQVYLDRDQAAAYLRLSPRTLDTWAVRRSDGPPFCKLGKRVVYRRSDLDSWAAARVMTSTSDLAAAGR